MSSSDYAKDVLVSADWVEDHLEEFQSEDPAMRLVEVNNPESPEEGDFPSRYDQGHAPGTSASSGTRTSPTGPSATS